MKNAIRFSFLSVLIILATAIFCSCGSHEIIYRDTIIRDTFIKAAPPVFRDVIKLQGDTIVKWAYRTNGKDTVLKIRYYPKTDTLHIEHKPDTVMVPFQYTKQEYKPIVQQVSKTSFWDYFPFLLAIGSIIIGYLIYKHGKAQQDHSG